MKKNNDRRSAIRKKTRGTEVEVELRLDGAGHSEVHSQFELLSILLELAVFVSALKAMVGFDIPIEKIDELLDSYSVASRRAVPRQ